MSMSQRTTALLALLFALLSINAILLSLRLTTDEDTVSHGETRHNKPMRAHAHAAYAPRAAGPRSRRSRQTGELTHSDTVGDVGGAGGERHGAAASPAGNAAPATGVNGAHDDMVRRSARDRDAASRRTGSGVKHGRVGKSRKEEKAFEQESDKEDAEKDENDDDDDDDDDDEEEEEEEEVDDSESDSESDLEDDSNDDDGREDDEDDDDDEDEEDEEESRGDSDSDSESSDDFDSDGSDSDSDSDDDGDEESHGDLEESDGQSSSDDVSAPARPRPKTGGDCTYAMVKTAEDIAAHGLKAHAVPALAQDMRMAVPSFDDHTRRRFERSGKDNLACWVREPQPRTYTYEWDNRVVELRDSRVHPNSCSYACGIALQLGRPCLPKSVNPGKLTSQNGMKVERARRKFVFTISQPWAQGFFHFAIESFPRVAYLLELAPTQAELDKWTVVVTKKQRFVDQLLELVGIRKDAVMDLHATGALGADVLWTPPVTRCGQANIPAVRRVVQEIFTRRPDLARDPSSSPARIVVIKRSGARQVANHNGLMQRLRSEFRDADVREFTSLAIADTVRLFAHADWVVAPHGAGLSNVMFAMQPIHVLEFLVESEPNPCYVHLAAGLGHDYHGMIVPGSTQGGVMTVDINKTIKTIRTAGLRAPRNGMGNEEEEEEEDDEEDEEDDREIDD